MPDTEVEAVTHEYVPLIHSGDLWDGEMESFDVGDEEVLLLKVDGQIRAYDGICPHQSVSLIEGALEGATLTCRAHEWQFDALSGTSVNPRGHCLRQFECRVTDEGVVEVSVASQLRRGDAAALGAS